MNSTSEVLAFAESAVLDAHATHMRSGGSRAEWTFIRRFEVNQMLFEGLVTIHNVPPSDATQIIDFAGNQLQALLNTDQTL